MSEPSPIDEQWMRHALALAERAQREDDEIPVGAVVVDADGNVVGEGWNRNIASLTPAAATCAAPPKVSKMCSLLPGKTMWWPTKTSAT